MEIFILALAFLIGSIPSGYIIGKLYGVDVRSQGSGNTGATNVSRVLGKRAGVTTLLLDILKGVVATQVAILFYRNNYFFSYEDFYALAGFLSFLGHCYSPFLNFNGGKGVATGLGIFLVISPPTALIAVLLFAAVFKLKGYVSLGSIVAAISLPFSCFFLFTRSTNTILISALTCLIVVYRHRENISRLIAGNENKFIRKSS